MRDSFWLRWLGDSERFVPETRSFRPEVVDSWLVDDGRTRAFDRHTARFTAACPRLRPDRVRTFLDAVQERIPSAGRWFPRVEMASPEGNPQLTLWLRPAPPRGETVRLWVSPSPDGRTRPRVKGPDLTSLAQLRDAATEAGANEAVLLSREGHVLEGSTTSLLWWRGEVLCGPPETAAILPSVTRAEVLALAAQRGIEFRPELSTPAELAGADVWTLNALHGIRPVSAWAGSPFTTADLARAEAWHHLLAERTDHETVH
ncbi:aminotransferase class IV [Amycolatopsis carbonis]|uniref:Aminotransferase class IV n=1 Tax=Amycolatopsis carbonis TaxID=715471 RepID=A0A9Y2IDK8_9PSEU|nr:aminotransferase class IV [Amycolatopsis sp. 2-15]WIX77046.1 aminotransferase class IV [Amycolatopsis sp. 2-15]